MSSEEGKAQNGVVRTHIGNASLEELRDRYHSLLFEDYLPFFDRHGIDHELGGFMCTLNHDGTLLDSTKDMWYQGRGLWVYSYLYNHFGGDEHLEVARKTRDFIVRHGRDDNGDWVRGLDREGNVVQAAETRGYTSMFVAEGLQEYAKASGDQESMDLAVDILWRAMGKWDDPDCDVDEGYIPISYAGMRTQGCHMVAILILTQMLKQQSDPKLEELADRVVDGVMNRFWNPEYRLNNEALDHNYERPNDANEDFIYLGHAMETLWMLLPEAMRRQDRALFDLVAERLQRHIEVAWDDVYGGFFRAMNVNGAFTFDKVFWAQEEVLIGTTILLEHTDLEWPEAWFSRTYEYIHDKFWLKPHGYPLFMSGADRKGTFQPNASRKENYHHPRHLMLNLLALERMIERGGKVSDFWGA
jgi:N-acylglucosamine 2-epimerase